MEDQIIVERVSNETDLQQVFAIRRKVFVDEQNCPPELEWEFEEESVHFLGKFNGVPAGASRWRKTLNGYKLERFAVLKEFREKGMGQALVAKVLNDLPKDAEYVYLHAQLDAMPLYAKFGFEKAGEQFEEAGIQHFKMILQA
ncbi:GNAT family N-acetyltransferase [Daejeonella sp.]|uniref:GNAT family N-acetyltransferase n=1 Tax=Daejeonella sp. TaxID=2805397 RepID=UPI0035244766